MTFLHSRYGSCWGNEIGWQQASAVQNTWYAISDADMSDGQLQQVAHDGSGKLTVTEAGVYLVNYSVTLTASVANKHIQSGILINSAIQNDGIQHADGVVTTTELTISSSALLSLTATQFVEVGVRTTDAGTPNIDVDHLNITLLKMV